MKLFRVMLVLIAAIAAPALAEDDGMGVAPKNAWNLLRDGNERFARGLAVNPHSSKERRNEVIKREEPFAVVLSCADSRIPVEQVFDAGVGDIFSVRVLGNAASGDMVVGSVEYGALHTHAKLIVVLGHESCGAVKAALDGHKEAGTQIEGMIHHVRPAAENAEDKLHDLKNEDRLAEAVERNVLNQMRELLLVSPKIAEGVRRGDIMLVGGVYSLHTGRISWLGEHPSQAEILKGKQKSEASKK